MTADPPRAEAVIDLGAIAANYERVSGAGVPVMGIVKADGYGHGAQQVARTLRGSGAQWLGVALLSEALELRAVGDRGNLLAWLWAPGDPGIMDCIATDVDLSVSCEQSLIDVVTAARGLGKPARIHIKVDTGLTRNGVPRSSWRSVFEAARVAQDQGHVQIVGIWSHLASADEPDDPVTDQQRTAFLEALNIAASIGVQPELRHLANSAAGLNRPDCTFDLVRSGIAIYGVTPGSGLGTAQFLGLRPAMTLRARLAHVKKIVVGTKVSYGGTWTADHPTAVGLVPVGYADGIPRAASNTAQVLINGRRCPVLGVIAMDQFVVDLGPDAGDHPGDEVLVFGSGDHGEPTAEDWAQWAGTIGYEIVTRIGPRVPRRYV
ncbi:MAG: alanine racemase [Actinomycetota bacterium]|nr:alanine racemase [Actinomycetota bacterium]